MSKKTQEKRQTKKAAETVENHKKGSTQKVKGDAKEILYITRV